jgi:uncharacterized repeat protein (TIGR03803 family)
MTKLSAWNMAFAISLVCAATAVFSPAQTLTTLVNFDNKDGGPYSGLIQGEDGLLYGATENTMFRITTAGLMTHFDFRGSSALVLAADGSYYGTSGGGGANDKGFVFKVTANGTVTMLHSFDGADGLAPAAGVVQGSDGEFYGTTGYGGAGDSCFDGCGTVFSMAPTGALTTLYSFCVQTSCLVSVRPSGLIQGTDGNFYGTTMLGGVGSCTSAGCGTVFVITPEGALTTLYSFHGYDGGIPDGGVIQGSDGNFYGTTSCCGQNGGGTVFRLTSGGALTTLYNFCSQPACADGAGPYAGVIRATDGNFYGTTFTGGGGSCGPWGECGTVFEMSPAGMLTTLHNFEGPDGSNPYAPLFQATDGNFYGTTYIGGVYDDGTIFSLATGLGPFVTFVRAAGRAGQTGGILGQGLTGTTSVSLNGIPASFTVESDTFIKATVPVGATTGYVTVTTPSGTLTSNVPFHVLP